MKINEFLEMKINDNTEIVNLVQSKIEDVKKTISLCKENNNEKAEAISELTNLNFRAVFHKGAIAAYTDIFNEYTKALESVNNEKS